MRRSKITDRERQLADELADARELALVLAGVLRRCKAPSVNVGHLRETVLLAHDGYRDKYTREAERILKSAGPDFTYRFGPHESLVYEVPRGSGISGHVDEDA
jgi:hypothetical protein